jgi:hypothetical protein
LLYLFHLTPLILPYLSSGTFITFGRKYHILRQMSSAQRVAENNNLPSPKPGEVFGHTFDEILLIFLIFASFGLIFVVGEKKPTPHSKIHPIFERYFNWFAEPSLSEDSPPRPPCKNE